MSQKTIVFISIVLKIRFTVAYVLVTFVPSMNLMMTISLKLSQNHGQINLLSHLTRFVTKILFSRLLTLMMISTTRFMMSILMCSFIMNMFQGRYNRVIIIWRAISMKRLKNVVYLMMPFQCYMLKFVAPRKILGR